MLPFHIRSTSQPVAEYCVRLDGWDRDRLPDLNLAVETGKVSLDAFITQVQPWITEANELSKSQALNRSEALWLIQLLGFLVGSVERHAQSQQATPGAGLARLSFGDNLLVNLAVIADHPPRDTHYTYWTLNSHLPLTFTGDLQEIYFNYAVNRTDQLHTISCMGLRPICQGELAVTAPEAVTALEMATHNMDELHQIFGSFMTKNEAGERNVTPPFFMERMRTYLPTYPIKGISWGGVNAANLASQMQVDYLIGTVNEEYLPVVQGRLRYLMPEDRQALTTDMQLPSVGDRLLEALQLSAADVKAWSMDVLTMYLSAQSPALFTALTAYKDLVTAAGRLSAMHWALIQNYLVKPAAKMSAEAKAHMAVNPDAGTGGMKPEGTEKIMRMRQEHPVIGKLVRAFNIGQFL